MNTIGLSMSLVRIQVSKLSLSDTVILTRQLIGVKHDRYSYVIDITSCLVSSMNPISIISRQAM